MINIVFEEPVEYTEGSPLVVYVGDVNEDDYLGVWDDTTTTYEEDIDVESFMSLLVQTVTDEDSAHGHKKEDERREAGR